MVKTYKNIYPSIYSMGNLILAWRKARKGKTSKSYVIEFEKNIEKNLLVLHYELKNPTYSPIPLKTFILRDPKTRKISKSDFRDRVVHHALVNILEPIFDKTFISDSCANRKGKGTLYALKRFEKFLKKVTKNGKNSYKIDNKTNKNKIKGFCFKADIKHYFQEVDTQILISIISRKIKDEQTIELIQKILNNTTIQEGGEALCKCKKGMPLGNLTSQFFANIYLNELDYFVKHKLKAKYYIRYVDDFVILHSSKSQLKEWLLQINNFLKEKLKLELHKNKSKIVPLSRGIDFVGFKIFYNYKIIRKRNIRAIQKKIKRFSEGEIGFRKFLEIYQGWQAYSKWADTFKLRNKLKRHIFIKILLSIKNPKYLSRGVVN